MPALDSLSRMRRLLYSKFTPTAGDTPRQAHGLTLKDDQRVWLQTYPLEQLCMAGLVVGKMVVSAVC